MRDRRRIEEERVVSASGEDDDVAAWKHRALRRDDDRVALGHDRRVRHVVFVRALSQPREHWARAMQIGADQESEAPRDLGPAERTPEGNGLRDARVPVELLHVPPRDEAAEAVTDEMNPRAGRNAEHELGEVLRDALDAETRCM